MKRDDGIIKKERAYGEAYSPFVDMDGGYVEGPIIGEWSEDTLALHLF